MSRRLCAARAWAGAGSPKGHSRLWRAPAPAKVSSMNTTQTPRRLTRSRDDRWIAGVCGGLGRYFGLDPVIVRLAAVALTFAGGAGLIAYAGAWLLVPEEGTDAPLLKGSSNNRKL